jgi:predicted metal-dependent hydrolase
MDYIEINHGDIVLNVELRRLSSARRYILRVHNAHRRAIITMPLRGSKLIAHNLATKNATWIHQRIQKIPDAVPFVPNTKILLRDEPYILIHHPEEHKATWLESPGLNNVGYIHISGKRAHFERRVYDFLKKLALIDLTQSVHFYCHKINIAPRSLRLRDTKSRWGSCSADGKLNFSWRLIMAPHYVLDYLAANEVCHLIHLNHSAVFWDLTRKLCAMTDQAEHWLKYKGTSLYSYGIATDDAIF